MTQLLKTCSHHTDLFELKKKQTLLYITKGECAFYCSLNSVRTLLPSTLFLFPNVSFCVNIVVWAFGWSSVGLLVFLFFAAHIFFSQSFFLCDFCYNTHFLCDFYPKNAPQRSAGFKLVITNWCTTSNIELESPMVSMFYLFTFFGNIFIFTIFLKNKNNGVKIFQSKLSFIMIFFLMNIHSYQFRL